MRRHVAVLMPLLFLTVLSVTAHADTFRYTIVDNIPRITPNDNQFVPYVGTYTFTVSSELMGETFVYGPNFTGSPFPGFAYTYASDFTVPSGSPVNQIEISYIPQSNRYAFTLEGDGEIGTSLVQDPLNPNLFTADLGYLGNASMEITDITSSPVPEPSTITLLGLGAIGIVTQIRRRIGQR